MRCKAHFFLNGEKSQENITNFGVSSNKTPPTVLELKPFEEDVLKLVKNIKFRNTKSHFQGTLANDLKEINSSDKMFVFADKTIEIYMKPCSIHTRSSYTTTFQKNINADTRAIFQK